MHSNVNNPQFHIFLYQRYGHQVYLFLMAQIHNYKHSLLHCDSISAQKLEMAQMSINSSGYTNCHTGSTTEYLVNKHHRPTLEMQYLVGKRASLQSI